MLPDRQNPIIALLWSPDQITSAVVEAARGTRTRAIFDLSAAELLSSGMALLQADASADAVDLKISAAALMDETLEELLHETGIDSVWVELHPLLFDGDPALYLERIVELSGQFKCFPVVSDIDLITLILDKHPEIEHIALKGCEASGFVSTESTLTLYGWARSRLRALANPPDLLIWGGVATPEAAAAFLSAGAQGIVFESLHWLTDLVSIDEQQRDRISKLRPEHTDLVGLNLQAPCRLFNKGNSKAVKDLRQFAGSLCGADIEHEHRRSFADVIERELVPPLKARFNPDELVPLGVDAAFAASFVRRFGRKTEEALDRFVSEIEAACEHASDKEKAFIGSSTARELGTRYPFVQGAMSWITDVPQFAFSVAEAGGLPTVALGLMDKQTLEQKLGSLDEIMGERPYAVNVITLAENPRREEQLGWIRAKKPRFTVIAAGEPSHARELLDDGLDVIYIAPNEELLKLAFSAGVRWAICEGNEAGGHVGEHTTLTLAQIILDLKEREPGLFQDRRIILAGGICNRETAFLAAMLGADAIQMGTCYLATKEIVQTGALTELYQTMVLESGAGGTVVTGEGTGLRVRSLKTPKIEEICSLERDFASGSEDESSFRQKIEVLAAGSLLIAARGLDGPSGRPLDRKHCIEQGQFMSGACAGSIRKVCTLKELHAELAEGRLADGLPFVGPVRAAARSRLTGVAIEETAPSRLALVREQPAHRAAERERIAITGMAVVNALGNSPEEVWSASLAMKSGIVAIPRTKWNHDLFYHPRPRTPEKTYCKVGAFQQIEVSRKELGIPPQDFRTMTNSTKITMWLAKQAIEDSSILESDIPRERIGVLISQNSGEAAATLEDVLLRGLARDIVSSVKGVVPLNAESEKAVEEAVKSGRMVIDDTTLLGRLNCTAGGFISNKYGFMGPSFSVSAACATFLVALYSAYQMIRNGVIDAAVVGGAEELLTPIHFLEFSALGALAGLSGVDRPPQESSRPFDADRDGMVLGEGGGMIVIERESLAHQRGARVHAYITAMGASNNHLGMVESSRVTQQLAIRASFDDALYGPDQVDLIECHATSTMQGDVEEVHALAHFFSSAGPTVLTSFKSQIGHTLGASGVNSLIRGVMAMNSGIFPSTLNFNRPDPGMDLEGPQFHIFTEPQEWPGKDGRPRRFQVNAFGFGGSNYVVQVEQSMEDRDRVMISPSAGITSLSTKATHAKVALPERVFFFTSQISGRPYRLAVLAESEKEALSLIESTEPIGNDGPIPAKRLRALARQGIHLGLAEGTPLPLAFVFPGQGSHYAGMSHELYQTFPVIRQWMDRAAKVAEFDLLQLLFYDREEDLQKTRWQQPALFTMEYAMVQYLASLGITPAALAGHSLGELTALCLAGVYSFEDGFRIVNMRATCMDNACELNADPGVMMAVDAPLDVVEKRLAATENIYITNINSPHQVVLGGGTEEVKALGEELKSQGYRRTLLRVSMAFHSPIMRCIHDELDEFIAGIEFHSPRIPVISNTTMKPFSSDPVEIKKTVMAHLETTVHWMQNVRTLWNDYGVRVFVEVGPRDILSNMIADTFSDATCVQTCLPSAESLMYRTALANLYASGHLPIHSQPLFVTLPGQGKAVRPVPSLPAAAALKVARPVSAADPVERILQREINAFVMESFGRFLRPAILGAIRREHDPGFTEKDLDRLFAQALGKVDIAAAWPADVAPAAIAPVSTVAPPVVPAARAADTAAVPPAAEAVPGVDVDASDVTESVIRIIMDATGYERDEIQPDMDLREDLSIRSSRLPVIMDSLESHFGIKIEIEEFMDVRTIGDIADKISEVVARGQKAAPLRARRAVEAEPAPDVKLEPEPKAEKEKIKRLVFREIPISREDVEPIELNSGDVVAIVSASASPHLASETEDLFRQDYGVNPVLLTLDAGISQGEGDGFDLRDAEWGAKAGRKLQEMGPPAGIVFVVDEACADITKEMKDISSLLRGFFMMVKAFVDSPAKKFVLVLHKAPGPEGRESILAEGALGVLLSLVHEFSSIQCRCVGLDDKTETATALRGALDRNNKVVELICRNGEVYTREWHVVPSSFEDAEQGRITPGDVVVLSGGAFGITYHLARSLVPLGCRLVFLGRTALDPDIDFRALLSEQVGSTEAVAAAVAAAKPGLTGDDLKREIAKVARALQIVRNVEELRSRGIDAAYYRCDVADAEQTQHTVDEIIHRYGRIDGIVHGAGIIRDNFVKNMTADDFSAVTDVKFLGAWNLYQACRQAGLKFVTCLSSAASIQGNPGQVNYAAGNRLMSALAAHLAAADKRVSFKSFMLPPIEGAGMAEDPEVRAMMKRIKASYVHVDELAEIFCREMLFGRAQDVRVLFMRSLPDLKTVRLDASEPAPTLGEMVEATVCFKNEDFPLIDSISRVDLSNGEIVGHRTFVREKDLWINDHKPFRFMKHPIVSAIVALETLMEAARMLYPYLLVQGVRDAQFLDIIDCPPGVERSSVIACNAAKTEGKNLLCEVTLATSEISPSGQILERMRTNFRATVLMGCGQDAGVRDFPGFPVKLEELDTRPMDHAEAMQKYGERGELHGRYRVIEEFDGTGPGAIRGRTVYRQGDDFAPPLKTRYQYSPYALEALMQSAIFYIGMRNEEDRRLFIPQRMGELIWFRKCVDGERLTIEGRLKRENEEGVLWDARALDEKGQTVMYLRDMVFRWFSG